MSKIVSGTYFPTDMQNVIFRLFDAVSLTTQAAKNLFVHSGAKGGSANIGGMTNAALAVSGYA